MTEQEIFAAAMDLPKSEQAAYLDQACADNAELRLAVEELLKLHESEGDFMQVSAATGALDDKTMLRTGSTVGPYKLHEQLGEGGMGVVFRATQKEPIERDVAIKIIKPGLDTKEVVSRFQAEQKTLAMMDHPFVAKVLEAGQTETGRPYFVMELVDGSPITEFCDSNQLTMQQRLVLFIEVCKAVQHAHSKSVIHRDIKPSNVLVQMFDGVPKPKVIDFGVAKALDPDSENRDAFTRVAQVVGTPLYMSPEQADAEKSRSLDTRTDIYSLGVLLYELLTGTTPFDRERLLKVANEEVRRIIREEEPQKPSTKISTLGDSATSISASRSTDLRKLQRTLQGELDWIVMKALDKDRERRYETAVGFADDVQRFLDLEPVLASPPSKLYRWKRMAQRNRGAVITAATIALTLMAGTVGTTWGLINYMRANSALETSLKNEEKLRQEAEENEEIAEQKSKEAVQQAEIANAVSDFFNVELLAAAMPSGEKDKGRNVSIRTVLDAAVDRLDLACQPGGRLAEKPMVSGRLYYTMGVTYYRLGELMVARKLLEKSHQLRAGHFGDDDELTLEPLHALAGLYSQIGELDLSDETSKKVIAGFERIKGPDARATLLAKSNLAANFMMRQRQQEATRLYEEITDGYLRSQGPEHPETLSFQANLVNCYRVSNQNDKARKLALEILPVAKRVDTSGMVVSFLLQNLGAMEAMERRFADATGYLEEAIEIRTKVLGNKHPDTLEAMQTLVQIEMVAGEYESAAKRIRQIYETKQSVLGPIAVDTLASKIEYLKALTKTKAWSDAVEEAGIGIDAITKAHGFRHASVKRLMVTIGDLAKQLEIEGREDDFLRMRALEKKFLIGISESKDATPAEIHRVAETLMEMPTSLRDMELAEKSARLAITQEEKNAGDNVEQYKATLQRILESLEKEND